MRFKLFEGKERLLYDKEFLNTPALTSGFERYLDNLKNLQPGDLTAVEASTAGAKKVYYRITKVDEEGIWAISERIEPRSLNRRV
jgi:hypothetical protein